MVERSEQTLWCCTKRDIQEMPAESLGCQDTHSLYTSPHQSQGLEDARVSVGYVTWMLITGNALLNIWKYNIECCTLMDMYMESLVCHDSHCTSLTPSSQEVIRNIRKILPVTPASPGRNGPHRVFQLPWPCCLHRMINPWLGHNANLLLLDNWLRSIVFTGLLYNIMQKII